MFNAETVVNLYENLYSHAFKLKRRECNLGMEHRGLLVCDAFTGSHSETKGHDARRLRWSEACNVELPCAQPGGWSAKGQPCDQIFCHFKERVRECTDRLLGFGQTYFDRPRYEELPLAPTVTFFAFGWRDSTCIPKWMVYKFIVENPRKLDEFGVPPFQKTSERIRKVVSTH